MDVDVDAQLTTRHLPCHTNDFERISSIGRGSGDLIIGFEPFGGPACPIQEAFTVACPC
jgi:hypothetical protein